jgi:ribonuclease HI
VLWARAASRRTDMQGLELGVESDASSHLLRCRSDPAFHTGILRSVLAGAVTYGHRLFRAGITSSNICPFCTCGMPETLDHMYWECPAWREERFKHSLATTAFKKDWPSCFRCCGILCNGVAINEDTVDWDMAADTPEPVTDPVPGNARFETLIEGKVVVYTDGACVHNQLPALRRAGVGVWWGRNHPNNYSAPLAGHNQTNQRAELTAVIYAVSTEARPVHIKSDSAYVVNGCTKFRHSWAALGWRKVKNADLWKQLHTLMLARPDGTVLFTKVKGHASKTDVRRGRVRSQDKTGNDAADLLATAGAAAHALPESRVREYKLRMAVAHDVQCMMTDIVAARGAVGKQSYSPHTPMGSKRRAGLILPGAPITSVHIPYAISAASDELSDCASVLVCSDAVSSHSSGIVSISSGSADSLGPRMFHSASHQCSDRRPIMHNTSSLPMHSGTNFPT